MMPTEETNKVPTVVSVSGVRDNCKKIAMWQLAVYASAIAVLYYTWYYGAVGVVVALLGLSASHQNSFALAKMYYWANVFMVVYGALMLVIWVAELYAASWTSLWVFALLFVGFSIFALLQYLGYKGTRVAHDFLQYLEQHLHEEITTPSANPRITTV